MKYPRGQWVNDYQVPFCNDLSPFIRRLKQIKQGLSIILTARPKSSQRVDYGVAIGWLRPFGMLLEKCSDYPGKGRRILSWYTAYQMTVYSMGCPYIVSQSVVRQCGWFCTIVTCPQTWIEQSSSIINILLLHLSFYCTLFFISASIHRRLSTKRFWPNCSHNAHLPITLPIGQWKGSIKYRRQHIQIKLNNQSIQ